MEESKAPEKAYLVTTPSLRGAYPQINYYKKRIRFHSCLSIFVCVAFSEFFFLVFFQSKFVEELADPGRIRELILDQYANYVVQRALTVANNEEGLKLVSSIRPHLHSMQVHPAACRYTTVTPHCFSSLALAIYFGRTSLSGA